MAVWLEMSNQNLQDAFLNGARKERLPVTIYLVSGVKLSGRVKGFDKYCVVFETSHQEQLIFKHAISTVVTAKQHQTHGSDDSHRAAGPAVPRRAEREAPAVPLPPGHEAPAAPLPPGREEPAAPPPPGKASGAD